MKGTTVLAVSGIVAGITISAAIRAAAPGDRVEYRTHTVTHTVPGPTRTVYVVKPACARLASISADMVRAASVVDTYAGTLSDLITETGSDVGESSMTKLNHDQVKVTQLNNHLSMPMYRVAQQTREFNVLRDECK